MKKHTKKHMMGLKIITTLVVCLVFVNTTAGVIPDNGYMTIDKGTLAVQSVFQPLINAGIEDTAELVFEIIAGTRLMLAGKNATAVNGILTETYRRDKRDKRKIEFLRGVDIDNNTVKARFKVLGNEDAVLR